MSGMVRGPQYKYSSGVRNLQQVISVPTPITMQQVTSPKEAMYNSFHVYTSRVCYMLMFGTVCVCVKVMPYPVMEQAVHVRGQEPLTASMLASAPLMEQKQLLGMFL